MRRGFATISPPMALLDNLLTLHRVDSQVRALSGRGTTPQIFAGGKHIGGADELATWLASR